MNKIDWMRSLKVGDIVCDCRHKHLPIKKIYDRIGAKDSPWLRKISFYMPDTIYRWYNRMCLRFLCELYDKDLILEDDSQCSAMNCCDPADHKWSHDSDTY